MKRKTTDTQKFKKVLVNLPEDLSDRLDQHFFNPVTGKPKYGAKSQLITKLLTTYFRNVEAAKEAKTTESKND